MKAISGSPQMEGWRLQTCPFLGEVYEFRSKIQLGLRFLYFKFKPDRYYWGCIQIFRAMILSLTPIVTESVHAQIV